MPALGTLSSYIPVAASGLSSRNGLPGSSSRSTRSRTSSFPRPVCFSRADSEPPRRATASRSRSSATRSRISAATAVRLAIINRWGQRYAGWQARRMSLRWQCVVVDCVDPEPVAAFWAAALGWRRTHTSVDGGEIVLEPPAGSAEDGVAPDLLFIRVPDPTPGKNRLHLDLRPEDQQAEVDRLLGLGATPADVGQEEGASWVVLADVEGNE